MPWSTTVQERSVGVSLLAPKGVGGGKWREVGGSGVSGVSGGG